MNTTDLRNSQRNEIISKSAAYYTTTKQIITRAYLSLTGTHINDENDLELINENMQFLDIEYEVNSDYEFKQRYKKLVLDTHIGELLDPITLQSISNPSTPEILNRK